MELFGEKLFGEVFDLGTNAEEVGKQTLEELKKNLEKLEELYKNLDGLKDKCSKTITKIKNRIQELVSENEA